MSAGFEDTVAALRGAFDALLPLANPQRQIVALRSALRALLDDQASLPIPRPSRPRAAPLVNAENLLPWPELRERLRARMECDRIATAELAAAVGVTRAHATRMLCPSGGPPGSQVRAALEEWLSARDGLPVGRASSGQPEANAPGVSRPERANGTADLAVEPDPEPIDPHRLTIAQRERLAAILQFDAKSLREAGLSADLVERAVVGENLEPVLVECMAAFLS